jgi:hypothetical protein
MRRILPPAAAALLAVSAAATEPPRYVVALWDGRQTEGGAWFALDGMTLPRGVRLSVVHELPEGQTIEAEAGRLVLSSELAALLGVEPDRPTLVEVTLAADALGPSPAGLDEGIESRAEAAEAAVAHPADRVAELLAELQAETSAAMAADLEAARRSAEREAEEVERRMEPPVAPVRSTGGLLPYGAGVGR